MNRRRYRRSVRTCAVVLLLAYPGTMALALPDTPLTETGDTGRTERVAAIIDGAKGRGLAGAREASNPHVRMAADASTVPVRGASMQESTGSDTAAGDDVQAAAPWYATPLAYLFYALFIVGAAAFLFAAIRVRTRKLRARTHELEQVVHARTAELDQVAGEIADSDRRLSETLSELKAAQQQVIHQEKLASLGALTAGIAHEIKNPLNFINNFASLNKELIDELTDILHGNTDEEVGGLLADLRLNTAKIEEHGRRADAIVRSMLEHSRGSKGERRPVDLNALAEEFVGLAYHGKRAHASDFNITIDRDFDAEVGEVEVVPEEIGRVLINLLGNAFDALHGYGGPPGGSTNGQFQPTLRLVTRRSGDAVTIRVEDNGPGVPDSVRQQIFEPFFTTKPSGSGTGLGLSMSHEIITQGHGGTLTLESEENAGAAFTIMLPAARSMA